MVLLGVLLLLFARFHRRLHGSAISVHLDSAAFTIEAAVMGIIAALYFERGKHLLPWCYAGVTLAYISLAIHRRARGSDAHRASHAPDHLASNGNTDT